MDPVYIGDLFREALFIVFMSVSIIILPSLMVGLVVSTFQAATQINEQTLSFLPRLLVTITVLVFMGPYLVAKVVDFAIRLYSSIPMLIG